MDGQLEGPHRPTPEQELLLRAALLDGEAALAAWGTWIASVDPQTMDVESMGLAGLLYHNLQPLGLPASELALFKGVFRKTWYVNQLLTQSIASVLLGLERADVRPLVLKGAPLCLRYYRSLGTRPMHDFRVLVRPSDARRALDVLQGLGWNVREPKPPALLALADGVGLENDGGQGFGLQWRAFPDPRLARIDDLLWRSTVELEIGEARSLTLDPTAQLLHTCLDATALQPHLAPLRWIADLFTVLSVAADDLDWTRLIDAVDRLGVGRLVYEPLGYLAESLGATVPAPVLAELRDRSRVAPDGRGSDGGEADSQTVLARLRADWRTYDLFVPDREAVGPRLLGFLRYLHLCHSPPYLRRLASRCLPRRSSG